MNTSKSLVLGLLFALSSSASFAQSEMDGKPGARVGTPIAAPAATISYTGNTLGGPTWNRPLADCSGLSGVGTATPYSTQQFHVSTAGAYDLFSDQGGAPAAQPQGGFDGFILVYADSFNPASPLTNCIAGDDDAGVIGLSEILGLPLDANRTYVYVTTGFANTDAGPFTNQINGPGNIVLGPAGATEHVQVDAMSRSGLLALALVLGLAGFVAVRRYS
jgi:hypothetical protein